VTCTHCLETIEVAPLRGVVHARTGTAWCDPQRAPERPGYTRGSIYLVREGQGRWIACEAEATEAAAAPRP
jgi:hypothetical protein